MLGDVMCSHQPIDWQPRQPGYKVSKTTLQCKEMQNTPLAASIRPAIPVVLKLIKLA